jgi:hypothetical protein
MKLLPFFQFYFLYLSLLCPSALLLLEGAMVDKDVCILGSGASGMSTAAFLKDNGYDVIVLEKENTIGGHCNTIYFSAPDNTTAWIDIGVQLFYNTTSSNLAGLGPYLVNSVDFVQRFAGPYSVIPVNFVSEPGPPNYAANFETGQSFGYQPPTPPSPEYVAAFQRLVEIGYTYPWLELADFPDPLPPELLVPFSEYVVTNQLEPLADMLHELLYDGGLGPWSNLTTLYALLNLAPSIMRLLSTPGTGFVVNGGCAKIYDGIRTYLGEANVLTNAQTIVAVRPTQENHPVILTGQIESSTNKLQPFVYACQKLVVAFPPTSSALGFMLLDQTESGLFSLVQTRPYFTGAVQVEGGLDHVGAFSLTNVDPTQTYDLPFLPSITSVSRDLPFGPAQIPSVGNSTELSFQAMSQAVQSQLGNIANANSPLFSSYSMITFLAHVFQPHFPVGALAESPTPYTMLEQLQGHRNTYYIGAVKDFAQSTLLWEKSYRFVNDYFPHRH